MEYFFAINRISLFVLDFMKGLKLLFCSVLAFIYVFWKVG